jgi:hypothetical protein
MTVTSASPKKVGTLSRQLPCRAGCQDFWILEDVSMHLRWSVELRTYRLALKHKDKSAGHMAHRASDDDSPDDSAIQALAAAQNAEIGHTQRDFKT